MTRFQELKAAEEEFDAAYDAACAAYEAELARIDEKYPQ